MQQNSSTLIKNFPAGGQGKTAGALSENQRSCLFAYS